MYKEISEPKIVSQKEQQNFENVCIKNGLDFTDKWVGQYVEYEWRKLPIIFEAYNINPKDLKVLEFGCNVGASAIIYSHLGAKVTAVDNSENIIEVAKSNSNRYGIDDVEFCYIEDTRKLPFENNQFDIVNCFSVLEYTNPDHLNNIQTEINRVLNINGKILIGGTSNRLWPIEIHTKRFLINYIPRLFDKVFGVKFPRGVFPWTINNGFGKSYLNTDLLDNGNAYFYSRNKMGNCNLKLKLLKVLTNLLGVSPGYLTPNIFFCLEKKE